LESLNAVLINEGVPQSERLAKLNAVAINQMRILIEDDGVKQLPRQLVPNPNHFDVRSDGFVLVI